MDCSCSGDRDGKEREPRKDWMSVGEGCVEECLVRL